MPTTETDRIRAHFKGLKKRWDYRNSGLPVLFMELARQWKRPIAEIKNIVGYHGKTDWASSLRGSRKDVHD